MPWEAIYQAGQEGVLAYCLEAFTDALPHTGMVPPGDMALPDPPVPAEDAADQITPFLLVGASTSPGYTINDGTEAVYPVAGAKPARFDQGLREIAVTFTVNLSAGAPLKKLLQCALRETPVLTIPATSRHLCMPVVAILGGVKGACDATTVDHDEHRTHPWTARYGMVNSLTITAAQGSTPTAKFEIWPVTLVANDSFANLIPAAYSEGDIATAAGAFYGYQQMALTLNSTAVTPAVNSLTITVNNNLKRVGRRGGDDAKLLNCPRQIQAGRQITTVEVGVDSSIPATSGESLGNVVAVFTSQALATLTITASGSYRQSSTRNETEPTAGLSYRANIVGTGITIT